MYNHDRRRIPNGWETPLAMDYLQIHSLIRGSRVNGPGNRFVIWTQGCSKNCSQCYNKSFKKKTGGILYRADELAYNMIDSGLDGITISGGEPLDQAKSLLSLLTILNENIAKFPTGIIMFSGYTYAEILLNPIMAECVQKTDLLIEGRYIDELRQVKCIAGSSNQRFVYLEKDGRGKDLVQTIDMDRAAEIHFCESSSDLIVTGFPFLTDPYLQSIGIQVLDE